MKSAITVRDIDPGDKAWLKRQARQVGISMEELLRRLIREKRASSECRPKPSEAFRRHFGPEHGVDLPLGERYGYRPVSVTHEDDS